MALFNKTQAFFFFPHWALLDVKYWMLTQKVMHDADYTLYEKERVGLPEPYVV